mgnify:FL=1
MADFPLPILVLFVFFSFSWFVLRLHRKFQDKQAALPQREDYLRTHGLQEAACHACGSKAFREIGLSHGRDERRIVSCVDCKELLFQFRREMAEQATP